MAETKKTIVMRKGDKFADIFDSSETIEQARRDGYHLCSEEELEARDALRKAEVKKQLEGEDKSNGNTGDGGKDTNPPNGSGTENQDVDDTNGDNDPVNIENGLLVLGKKGLLKFAGKHNIYDKSFKELEPEELVQKILETIRALVVKADLKTAEEADTLTESELLALFDTFPHGK